MMQNGWGLFRLGMKRRSKQVRRLRIMTCLAVFFLTTLLLFQDNINAYTMQMNYRSYGSWVFQSTNDVLESNPYLYCSGTIRSGSRIYLTDPFGESNNRGEAPEQPTNQETESIEPQLIISAGDETRDTGRYIGVLPESFAKENGVSLYEGRFPLSSDEIVIERGTLQAMGLDYQLGKTISFYVSEPIELPRQEDEKEKSNNNQSEGIPKEDDDSEQAQDLQRTLNLVQFTLVGTMDRYSLRWNSCGDLPSAVITQEAFDALNMDKRDLRFYSLKPEYAKGDVWSFAVDVIDGVTARFDEGEVLANRAAFFNPFWGNPKMYQVMTGILLLLCSAILAYLMAAYLEKRQVYFLRLRELGSSTMEVFRMASYECVGGALPLIPITIALCYGLSLLAVSLAASHASLPFFYVFSLKTFFLVLGCTFLTLTVSLAAAFVLLSGKSVTQKRRSMPKAACRSLRRRSLRRRQNTRSWLGLKETLVRRRRLHPVQTLMLRFAGIISCAVLLLCVWTIQDRAVDYRNYFLENGDFQASRPYHYAARYTVPVEPFRGQMGAIRDRETWYSEGYIPSLKNSIPDSFFAQLEELPGVEAENRRMTDGSRLVRWSGRDHDPFFQAYLLKYAELMTPPNLHTLNLTPSEEDENARKLARDYLDALSLTLTPIQCWEDGSALWETYQDALENGTADRKAFLQGEQVIVCVDSHWRLVNLAQYYSGQKGPEDADHWTELGASFSVGDELEIVCRNGTVPVRIAAVVEDVSDTAAGFPIFGSQALIQRIAEMDGIPVGFNEVRIDLNSLSNRENTAEILASLCADYGLSYQDNTEVLREKNDAYYRSVLTYGFFGIVLTVLYLFICSAVAAEQRRRLVPSIALYRRFGSEYKALRSAVRRDALKQSLWLLWSVPVFLAARTVFVRNEVLSGKLFGFYSVLFQRYLYWTGRPDIQTESSPWKISVAYVLEHTSPLMLIPLFLMLLAVWYLTGKTDKGGKTNE